MALVVTGLLAFLLGAGLFFYDMGQLPGLQEQYTEPAGPLALVGVSLVFLASGLWLATLFLMEPEKRPQGGGSVARITLSWPGR